jgi:hypothetical protein
MKAARRKTEGVMGSLNDELIQYFQQNSNVRSVIMLSNDSAFSPLTDGFDILLLVLCYGFDANRPLSHYMKHHRRIQERWVDADGLQQWVAAGENRRIIEWLIQGSVLFDRDGYLTGLRANLLAFPAALRERRLLIEFSAFLRTYLQSKEYLNQGHFMDAFSNILEALHHWARIAIIEQGIHPEVTVWQQLRTINVGVFKLYEELILSPEPIEKRIQLLILASEFFAATKLDICCTIIFRILRSRTEPWAVHELAVHPDVRDLPIDINMILHKLTQKMLVREVVWSSEGLSFEQTRYTVTS